VNSKLRSIQILQRMWTS